MQKTTRRSFLGKTLLTGAAIGFSARSWAQVPGANSDIRVATVGFNGRGESHIEAFGKMDGVRMAALCDADKKVLERGVNRLGAKGPKVQGYSDIRKLLESKEIDVITIATPNHWHSLMGIWSIQAGKDVYVEKPVSHNVWEGRRLVETARQFGKIVQTGTQSRSETGLREAIEWVRAGNLGKIKVSRGLCYKPRVSIGKVAGPQPIPEGIDYDLWCGPAPMEPLMRKNLHYDWHWVWPTGCGDLGNQGIHQMDIARWALGKQELSPKVFSIGGRLGYDDDGTTPNTQMVVHDYGDALLIFEVRGLPRAGMGPSWGAKDMDKFRGQSIGNIVECEGGYLSGTVAYDKQGSQIKKFSGNSNHFENFIKAVRSRKTTDLNADILEGHLSSALCHTGNISYRLGQKQNPDEIREAIKADKEALETLGRMEEHLKANMVDINSAKLTMGPFLKMDPKSERFIDNDAANRLLTRDYRAPYVVPAKA